jgi:hypothetical protein
LEAVEEGRQGTDRQQQLETLLQRIGQLDKQQCEWPGCRRRAARFFLPVGEDLSSPLSKRVNLLFCAPHFGAAREAEELFWPPKPPVPLDAESLEEATNDELIRWAKGCARDAKKRPNSGIRPDEFEPYRREKAARLGPVFVARPAEPSHLGVAGERPADLLVHAISPRKPRGPAGYRGERTLQDPQFRVYLATLVGEAQIADWIRTTDAARSLKRQLERAERGNPDAHRPMGARDKRPRKHRAGAVDYARLYLAYKDAVQVAQRTRGVLTATLTELLEKIGESAPEFDSLKRGLYRWLQRKRRKQALNDHNSFTAT